jgi:hypothetical protein
MMDGDLELILVFSTKEGVEKELFLGAHKHFAGTLFTIILGVYMMVPRRLNICIYPRLKHDIGNKV